MRTPKVQAMRTTKKNRKKSRRIIRVSIAVLLLVLYLRGLLYPTCEYVTTGNEYYITFRGVRYYPMHDSWRFVGGRGIAVARTEDKATWCTYLFRPRGDGSLEYVTLDMFMDSVALHVFTCRERYAPDPSALNGFETEGIPPLPDIAGAERILEAHLSDGGVSFYPSEADAPVYGTVRLFFSDCPQLCYEIRCIPLSDGRLVVETHDFGYAVCN